MPWSQDRRMRAVIVARGRKRPCCGAGARVFAIDLVPELVRTGRAHITQAHHEEWALVVASLTSRFGDLDIAEEAAAEAFATAVERRPGDGGPLAVLPAARSSPVSPPPSGMIPHGSWHIARRASHQQNP